MVHGTYVSESTAQQTLRCINRNYQPDRELLQPDPYAGGDILLCHIPQPVFYCLKSELEEILFRKNQG